MSKLQRYRFVAEDLEPRSRMQRFLIALRSYTLGPLTSNSPEIARYLGAGSISATGIPVNEHTALNFSAFWAAVSMISSNCAQLPLIHYKRLPNGGKERFSTSKLYRLLHDQPNPEMTSIVWRRTVQAHALTWGGGYSEIERDGGNGPVALWPLTPDRVTPFRRGVDTPLQYRVTNGRGTPDTILDARDMLHIPGLGWDGTRGYSVIEKARESIGLGLAAERFGAKFYGNGSTFGGVLSYPGPRPQELSEKNYVESLKGTNQGVDRSFGILSVYNGSKFERLGVPPNDAQFLESRQFQVTEIARWFNIPPHKIGDLERATFSNIEQQDLDYYKTTLVSWLETWEQELTSKLVPSSERNIQFIEHMAEGFLRGDSAGRSEFYSKRFNTASITPNDIRESENQNPLVGGDRAFVPMNMLPLDRVDEWFDAEIASKKAKANPPAVPPPQPTGMTQAAYDEVVEQRDLARKVAHEAADAADFAKAGEADLREKLLILDARLTDTLAGLETERAARLASEQQLQFEIIERQKIEQGVMAATADLQQTVNDQASRLVVADERIQLIEGDYLRVCGEKLDLSIRAGVSEAKVLEAEAARETAMTDRETHALSAAEALKESAQERAARLSAESALLEALAKREEAALLASSAEQARQEAEAAGAALKALELQRMTAVIGAHRALIVDAMGRMIRRETEKARRAQATPEKLRTWMENFYPVHQDICEAALLPAIRTHLAWSQADSDPDEVTRAYVTAHIEHSIRQLRAVLESDPDDYAGTLETTLRRWELDRADALADDLLKKEVAYVASR